jgi:hypothetical protein
MLSRMKRNRILGLTVLPFLGLACSAGALFAPSSGTQTSVPRPTFSGTERPPREGKPIYSQDFNSPDPELWSSDTESLFVGQADGGYRVFVGGAYQMIDLPLFHDELGFFPDNLIINVDVTKRAGPKDSAFSIICRESGTYGVNDIGVEIWEDGAARIQIFRNSEIESDTNDNLIGLGIPFHTGYAANRIHLECIGVDVFLYVNGRFAMHAQTKVMQSGIVHLAASTYAKGGADYLYDNLLVEHSV